MRKIYLLLVLSIAGFWRGCSSEGEGNQRIKEVESYSTSIDAEASPEISFDTLVNNLGVLTDGEQVVTFFKYLNTGNAPLLISSIKAGCGCTVARWNEEPLGPGEDEKIKVVFDSSGKKGTQNIRITVNSNARNSAVNLTIKALVNEKQ